jgi:hypothetical protein
VPLSIYVPDSSTGTISGEIAFDAGTHEGTLDISFTPGDSIAKLAFDISHSPWDIDTVYGQFKELYIELTENDISVTEIQNRSLLTSEYLSNFDAVFVLDPCAYGTDETNYNNPAAFSIPYTQAEIDAYEDYYHQGGGIFVSALSNRTVNVTGVNDFLEWTGFSLFPDDVTAGGGVVSVTDLVTHPITSGINSFAFSGAAVAFNSSAQSLATYNGRDVIAAMAGSSSGRLVVTGTNYFIDNWGMSGLYQTSSDSELAMKIALWLIGSI